jgi:uncharacterized membrane protein YgcG
VLALFAHFARKLGQTKARKHLCRMANTNKLAWGSRKRIPFNAKLTTTVSTTVVLDSTPLMQNPMGIQNFNAVLGAVRASLRAPSRVDIADLVEVCGSTLLCARMCLMLVFVCQMMCTTRDLTDNEVKQIDQIGVIDPKVLTELEDGIRDTLMEVISFCSKARRDLDYRTSMLKSLCVLKAYAQTLTNKGDMKSKVQRVIANSVKEANDMATLQNVAKKVMVSASKKRKAIQQMNEQGFVLPLGVSATDLLNQIVLGGDSNPVMAIARAAVQPAPLAIQPAVQPVPLAIQPAAQPAAPVSLAPLQVYLNDGGAEEDEEEDEEDGDEEEEEGDECPVCGYDILDVNTDHTNCYRSLLKSVKKGGDGNSGAGTGGGGGDNGGGNDSTGSAGGSGSAGKCCVCVCVVCECVCSYLLLQVRK